MKKLILLCALLANVAHAEEWWETPNNAGGKILFLTAKCDNSESAGLLVISSMSDGTALRGCWYAFADMVHVVWISPNAVKGETSAFDPKTLTYRKK